MKNIRTPRTLAECQFTVGHAEFEPRQRTRWVDHPYIFALVVACIGALGLIFGA